GRLARNGSRAMRAMTRWVLAAGAASLIFLSVAVGGSEAVSQERVPQLAQALLEFEANVTWESVSRQWRPQRDGWIVGVKAASGAAELAVYLLRLEAAMGWGAVEQAWRQRRPGW